MVNQDNPEPSIVFIQKCKAKVYRKIYKFLSVVLLLLLINVKDRRRPTVCRDTIYKLYTFTYPLPRSGLWEVPLSWLVQTYCFIVNNHLHCHPKTLGFPV